MLGLLVQIQLHFVYFLPLVAQFFVPILDLFLETIPFRVASFEFIL